MIIIGKYAELAPDMGFPSMKQYLQKEPYDTKAAVLKYLRNGHVHNGN